MILLLAWSNFTEIVFNENNASMKIFQFLPPPEQFPSQIYPLLDWWTHSECCERKFFISDSILIILRMENLHWRLMKFKLGVSFYKLFITGLPSAKPFQSWSFHQKIKGQKGAVWILKRIKQILDFQCHGGEIDALKRLNSRTDNCPAAWKQLRIC